MDLTKFFDSESNKKVAITVKGTHEEPLFQANQIGALLGIVNIRDSVRDFDEDEKESVATTDAVGKTHEMVFLTELGLYRLLGQSRKPIARPFQKWVAKVVKEIRITGRYELENKIQSIKDESSKAIQTIEQESAKKLEEIAQERDAAMTKLHELTSKTYEEVPKFDHIYVCKEASELHSDRHKVGKSIDPKKREAQFNTGSAKGVKMIYTRATHNASLIEDIIEVVMKRYAYAREHYMNKVEHTINLIDIAATMVDTLASTYEHIERKDLIAILQGKLQHLLDGHEPSETEAIEPFEALEIDGVTEPSENQIISDHEETKDTGTDSVDSAEPAAETTNTLEPLTLFFDRIYREMEQEETVRHQPTELFNKFKDFLLKKKLECDFKNAPQFGLKLNDIITTEQFLSRYKGHKRNYVLHRDGLKQYLQSKGFQV